MSAKQALFSGMVAILIASNSIAESKVVHVTETGFIVENQVKIERPLDVAWESLTSDVDRWWPKDHTWWGAESTLSIDAFAGGCFCERIGDKSAEHMRIVYADPGKLLRMIGGLGPLQGMGMHGALDWQFSEQDNTTIIRLTYRASGINPDGFEKLAAIVGQVQGKQLQGLANYLAK